MTPQTARVLIQRAAMTVMMTQTQVTGTWKQQQQQQQASRGSGARLAMQQMPEGVVQQQAQ
jgi:hypothetical protein